LFLESSTNLAQTASTRCANWPSTTKACRERRRRVRTRRMTMRFLTLSRVRASKPRRLKSSKILSEAMELWAGKSQITINKFAHHVTHVLFCDLCFIWFHQYCTQGHPVGCLSKKLHTKTIPTPIQVTQFNIKQYNNAKESNIHHPSPVSHPLIIKQTVQLIFSISFIFSVLLGISSSLCIRIQNSLMSPMLWQ
jgi:hypothetical protein